MGKIRISLIPEGHPQWELLNRATILRFQLLMLLVGFSLVVPAKAEASAVVTDSPSRQFFVGGCWPIDEMSASRPHRKPKRTVARKKPRTSASKVHRGPVRSKLRSVVVRRWICAAPLDRARGIPPFIFTLHKPIPPRRADPRSEGPVPLAPEPVTWLLMVVGFGLVGWSLRMRRRPSEDIYA